ncbi:MAG: hypothetical protein KDA44_16910 [Planctomycetales bacterium]|nr:hypothetical protein [Planctomycetales bacterium]
MNESSAAEPSGREEPAFLARLAGYIADALRYWEPRRLVYNGILAMVVAVHFIAAWPGSRDVLSLDLILGLFILAVLANLCYCAAYAVDIFVQFSGMQRQWRIGRLVLLTVGAAFAAAITHFFASGLFGR